MSAVDDVLAHHGVKGMQWGVRKDKGHEGEQASNRKIKRLDKKYDRSLQGIQGFVKVNNAVANRINPKLDVLNAKPEYQVDMTKPEHAELHKKYINEYRGHLEKSLQEAMDDIGTNASGTQRVHLTMDGEGIETTWSGYTEAIKHDSASLQFHVKPKFNVKGQITGQNITPADKAVAHGEHTVSDILEHHGVKGMKWGVRRRSSEPTAVSVIAPAGKRVKTSGGHNHPASEDAKTAAATRQKAKASTTDSLSNHELQALVKRMQLEQQLADLSQKRQSGAKKFVGKLLGQVGAQQAQRVGNDQAAQRIDSMLKKQKK